MPLDAQDKLLYEEIAATFESAAAAGSAEPQLSRDLRESGSKLAKTLLELLPPGTIRDETMRHLKNVAVMAGITMTALSRAV